MNLIFNLSLRNLLRQKKRNLMLGIGIAFGMMILVVANSFSHGMTEVLIKDIVTNAFGHLVVDCKTTNSDFAFPLIRDKARIKNIIQTTIKKEDLISCDESLGAFGRIVGNGETDNMMIVGINIDTAKEREDLFKNYFSLKAGNFDNFFSRTIEYPVIISESKAKSLNVKVNDVIRARFSMVTGQLQAAKFTVIAIANGNNTFMDVVLFMEASRFKKLLGYKPWEAAGFQLTLNDPKRTAPLYAEAIHRKLTPNLLTISGQIGNEPCEVFAFRNTSAAKRSLEKQIRITQGDPQKALAKKGVLISEDLAQKLQIKPGDELMFSYDTKFRGNYTEKFKIEALYQSQTKLGTRTLLMNEERIYDTFNRYLPAKTNLKLIPKSDSLARNILATEWKLFERSKDNEALRKKYKNERKIKSTQPKFDVITMYEGASEIMKLEGILNLITLIAVIVLFFIILIGVINTLRMTIRERTREIGTVRAIGMQKNDVRNMFIMETLLLTVISCLAGTILGIVIMLILGAIPFDVKNALSIILKNKHLFFKINPFSLASNFVLILAIAAATSYFPARRAAKLSAVEALRHYE